MTYTLVEQDGATTLMMEMDDNRPGASGNEADDDGGEAVLAALKATAESL
jgi:hypothetical protein